MEKKDKIIVCRCEDITYDEIVQAIREGFTTPDEIKRVLRCGMGPCQGRTCMRLIQRIIAKELNKNPAEIKMPKVRPPLRPSPIGLFAGEKNDKRES
ncbi:(2Fe-2S)-binding protein [archaeon]|nr:MAG: (2Fe-2S)-binding protein [archaeon]RLG65259.1 MAG: (2Fe-2S)-binding protein [archaeon]HDM23481.1 (2Fe-2S)-binding protein [Candidatus Bathyarchaeota archaeon]